MGLVEWGSNVNRGRTWASPFALAFVAILGLAACGSGASGGQSGASLELPDLPSFDTDSIAMTAVKSGRVKACPSKTIEQMADDFFVAPGWEEFASTTGETVVELTGTLSYDGAPATARLQFVVDYLDGFEASYLEIDGQAQNLLVLAGLFKKMCSA